jgi:hypothetical protein
MNHSSNKLAIISGLAIASANTISIPASAQSVSMTVSPMVTIGQLKGAQSRSSFSVSNKSKVPIRTRIYAQDFDYDKDKGYVKTSDTKNSANPYLQFSPKELIIPPGGTREVRLNITIPPSKPDGEYRVAVFTEDLTERKIDDLNSSYTTVIRPQIASVFFVTKGAITSEISAMSVGWNRETEKPRLLLKNQGQASAYPEINWQLKQGNTEIAKYSIQGIVLPGDKKIMPGSYILTGEIDNKDGKLIPFYLNVNVPSK